MALDLTGVGGKVRLWCFTETVWNTPLTDGAAECARAISGAYSRGLVPVVVLLGINSYPSDEMLKGNYDSAIGAKNYSTTADKIKSFVARLPTRVDRELWIELSNEPNFSEWWQTGVCDWRIRAYEVAHQSEQVARAIRSLGKQSVKIAGPSLAAFSDSDPLPDANGKCFKRGPNLRIRSADFILQMKVASPALFSTSIPLIDAWNVHAYPLSQYGLCPAGACPAPASDYAMTYYKEDLRAGGLPADFPVLITEFGHPAVDTSEGVDFLVRQSTETIWVGAIPHIFLPKATDNNVIGFMAYLLYLPGDSFSWANGKQTPFNRTKSLREAMLPAWQQAPVTTSNSTHLIYRKYTTSPWDFLFTVDPTEGVLQHYQMQFGAFWLYDTSAAERRPLFRCHIPATGRHFLSVDGMCEGQSVIFSLGFLDREPTARNVPLYRCYGNDFHLATMSKQECLDAGLKVEFILGYVPGIRN